jgi:hypothetical protein
MTLSPCKQRRRPAAALTSTAAVLALVLAPRPAIAGPEIGLDGEAVVPLSAPTGDRNSLDSGAGFKVRLGYQFHLPLIRLTPEVGYGFDWFSGNGGGGSAYAWDVQRMFAGGRIGLGEIVVPSVYAHAGYGWRTTPDPGVPEGSGLAFDAGLALDLHLIPHVGLGAHAEYASIGTGGGKSPEWLAFGLHVEIDFGGRRDRDDRRGDDRR